MQCYVAGLGDGVGNVGQESKPAAPPPAPTLKEVFLRTHPQGMVARLLETAKGMGNPDGWEAGTWAFRYLREAAATGLNPHGILEIIRVGHVVDLSLDPEHTTQEEARDHQAFHEDHRKNPRGVENMLNIFLPPRVRRRGVGYIFGPRRGRMELWTLGNFNNGGWQPLTKDSVTRLINDGVSVIKYEVPRDRIRPFTAADWAESLDTIKEALDVANDMARGGYPDRALGQINRAAGECTRSMSRARVLLDAGVYTPHVFEYVNEETLKVLRSILKLHKNIISQSYWKRAIKSLWEKNPWAGDLSRIAVDVYSLYEQALVFVEGGVDAFLALMRHLFGIEENSRIIHTMYSKVRDGARAVGKPIPPAVDAALNEAVVWLNGISLIRYELVKSVESFVDDFGKAWKEMTGSEWEGTTSDPYKKMPYAAKGLGALGLWSQVITALITMAGMTLLFALFPELLSSSAENAQNAEKALEQAMHLYHKEDAWLEATAQEIAKELALDPNSGVTSDDVARIKAATEQALRSTQGFLATFNGQLSEEDKAKIYTKSLDETKTWWNKTRTTAIIPPVTTAMIYADSVPPEAPPEGGVRSEAIKFKKDQTSPLLVAVPLVALAGLGYYYFWGDK